jgi:3-oxoacyl-[acyl-carrier protein] reductase
MNDLYQRVANAPVGTTLVRRLGLPRPAPLERHEPGKPVVWGGVLVGSARGGRLEGPVREVLRSIGAHALDDPGEGELAALVFDATGIDDSSRLRALYDFFHPLVRRLQPSGRLLVLGTPPEQCGGSHEHVAQRALEGFVRSLGKEVGRGSTAQLVYVSGGAEGAIESTLRFLLSARSAYVSGQVVRVGAVDPEAVTSPEDPERPLAGMVAVVTGSARGIGESIAATLARDGAEVVCLDVPAQGDSLTAVANRVGGTTLQLDITASDAPASLVEHMMERHGGLDIMVHNAGITRDRTLARMSEQEWDAVLAVNLSSEELINDALLERAALREGGRIVCVASLSGIAGNRGQANYATSKAGVIGSVEALAPVLSERRATINAVAPGFIESAMTDAMPVTTREASRRMNSLAQGGLPVDVAETIAWFAHPGSSGVNGNVVRVCGQSLLGA